MKVVKIIAYLIVVMCFFPDTTKAFEQNTTKPVAPIIEAFKTNNKDYIVSSINYPLSREYPIPAIKNKTEMLSRFQQVFDKELIQLIVNSDLKKDWRSMGWRGMMFSNGLLWLDEEGKIYSVNYQSDFEKSLKQKLINQQKTALHTSLQNYQEPILEWKTKKFRIRVDKLDDNNFRYASWSIDKLPSDKPDLVLTRGEVIFDGSGGNHAYIFTSGVYKYQCNVSMMGSYNSPPGTLEVFKGSHLILSQPVVEVLNQ